MTTARKPRTHMYHRFIDEAGDMTFFLKGKAPAPLGDNGISKVFILGMAHVKQDLDSARNLINEFCKQVENDPFFNTIPSVKKRIDQGGFYLHAKDDPAELRYKFIMFLIENISFSVQMVVGRKKLTRFVNKHHSQEREFYADLLSHLLKDKGNYERLVINIAERGSSTGNNNLEDALSQAHSRHGKRKETAYKADIRFNVQRYSSDPLLAITDYALWTVQRVFEKGETRFYDTIKDKLPTIIDLYDTTKYGNYQNYYGPKNTLTKDNRVEVKND